MLTLRPYQRNANYQLHTLINAGRHPILANPTGTGKTKTAIALIGERIAMGRRVWVLTPQTEIFSQWLIDAHQNSLNPGTINDKGIQGRDRRLYIVMPLSAVNLLHQIPERLWPDEIITDECHHSAATTWQSIYDFFPRAIRIGLTATPRRTDRRPLSPIYTDIIQTITQRESIDQGYLARPLCIVPKDYHARLDVPGVDIDTPEGLARQAAALGETQIIGDVLGNYAYVFAGLPVLVACSTYPHAEQMTAAFNQSGWKWAHIHSNLPDRERARMLRDIRTGKLNGLCTVGIGIEGMDIPGLYGLIWLRRTMSLTIYLQFIGRVLRPLKGKKYGVILDPVGNLFIHGFPDMPHEWSLDGVDPIEPNPDIPTMISCPWCGTYNATSNLVCHFCNRPLVGDEAEEARKDNARHLPAMVDGELIAVTSDGMAREVNNRADEAMEDSREEKSKEAARIIPVLTRAERSGILRGELFARNRPNFEEAIRGLK